MHPRDIAVSAERLREASVALLDGLGSDELDTLALPSRDGGPPWSVADVFRHLALSDREVVLGRHLLDFLPFHDADEFEAANDAALERASGMSRQRLRDELVAWGRRLRTIMRTTPAPIARLRVPTLFGRVTLAWLATLRVYDEWVHQDDIARALQRDAPPIDEATRDLLAAFHLRALPPAPLRRVDHDRGVVQVAFTDALGSPAWRFDLAAREYGPRVVSAPTASIECDVATWTRIAADRVSWRDAEAGGDLRIHGDDREAAESLLDVVRVV